MFNGIIETIGKIETLSYESDCLHLTIAPDDFFSDIKIGDSIAVNGICLTITKFTDKNFNVTIVPETCRKSNLTESELGSIVNLERSMKINDRIHGHYVQGHSDGVGKIIDMTKDGDSALLLKITIPASIQKYVVRKGYVALDGMSITIIEAQDDWITITLIPHTINATIAKEYQIGTVINIEVDILGKYIEKILRPSGEV